MTDIPVDVKIVREAAELLRSAGDAIDSEWNSGGDEFREVAAQLEAALEKAMGF